MKTKIQIGLIIILSIFAVSLLLSRNANPDNPSFFGLKRTQENVFLSLKSDPKSKVNYLSNILNSRLKEFENVIKNESYGYMWTSSLRYSTFAGRITDLIIANNLTDIVEPIKKQFEEHKKKLDIMYVAYPKNTNNVEWKYILDAINYLNVYLDKLSKIRS